MAATLLAAATFEAVTVATISAVESASMVTIPVPLGLGLAPW